MKGITTKNKIYSGLMPLLLIAIFGLGSIYSSLAQPYKGQTNIAPKIPELSLVGADGTYEEDWFPDGRLLVPVSVERITDANNNYTGEGNREIYVPIFIRNRWNTQEKVVLEFDNGTVELVPDPIESFKFTLLYRDEVFQPLGIVTEHPRIFIEQDRIGTDVPCDAKDWNISFDIAKSDKYRTYLVDPTASIDVAKGGMRMTITGVSNGMPLPAHNDYRILFYVKMRVRPFRGQPIADAGIILSQLIIDNEEIRYNNYNVTEHAPFIEWREHINSFQQNAYENLLYPGFLLFWPTPKDNYYNVPSGREQRTPGLAGITNYRDGNTNAVDNPTLPGVIYVRLLQELPRFGFSMERGIGSPEQLQVVKQGEFNEVIEMVVNDPLTIDSNSINPIVAQREFELVNLTTNTRIENIIIETDREWLEVQTIAAKGRNVVPRLTRRATFNYVDNGTLGDPSIDGIPPDEMGGAPKGNKGRVFFRISCDPSKLTNTPERAGMYEGYITIRSDNALNNVVRLKVVFIYFRTPREGKLNHRQNFVRGGNPGEISGIRLNIFNSRGSVPGNPGPDRTNIVFGTGHRATDGVDILFGETAYTSPLSGFGARFYALDAQGNPLLDENGNPLSNAASQFGFSDWAANDEQTRSASRDIRSSFDTNQSIIYYVKFDENGDQNYPVVIEWDTRDFMPGTELFLRDTQNGQLFPSVNMRTANALDQFRRSYTIQDQRVNDFLIEYTLPREVQFVDEFGNPIIKEGWNFLSLPVSAVNQRHNVLYPNKMAMQPIFFTPSTYQQEEILRVGIGYFMRYAHGARVDTRFAGTYISEISTARQNAPRVYPGQAGRGGWNTVGAISTPVSINNISFEAFQGQTPDVDYTLNYGVWRYVTDRGYEEVSTMLPGLGYWIKVNANGFYNLKQDNLKVITGNYNPRNDVYSKSTKIEIIDNKSRNGELFLADKNTNIEMYQLPPLPPTDVFDVRLRGNYKVDNTNETVINLQAVEYPVSISVKYADSDLTFTDALTGQVYGTIAKGTDGNVVIYNSPSNNIVVNRTEVADSKFGIDIYPNPVLGGNVINVAYSIPNNETVNIQLFDAVGNMVAQILKADINAGTYTLQHDVTNLTAGTYMVRVEAGSKVFTQKVNIIK